MKILVVFSCLLAVVLVSGIPFRSTADRTETHMLRLEEMVKYLKHLRDVLKTQDLGHKLILKVIDEHKCKPEDFCKVEKVLSGIDHNLFREKGILIRQLREYNRHFDVKCSIEESTEIPLTDVLRHLRTCAQKKYSKN